jgi:hypothetical protein
MILLHAHVEGEKVSAFHSNETGQTSSLKVSEAFIYPNFCFPREKMFENIRFNSFKLLFHLTSDDSYRDFTHLTLSDFTHRHQSFHLAGKLTLTASSDH